MLKNLYYQLTCLPFFSVDPPQYAKEDKEIDWETRQIKIGDLEEVRFLSIIEISYYITLSFLNLFPLLLCSINLSMTRCFFFFQHWIPLHYWKTLFFIHVFFLGFAIRKFSWTKAHICFLSVRLINSNPKCVVI